jgi:hypothetical protein
MSGYIGTQPVPQATQTRDSFTATSGQTSFATGGYTPNFLDVYLNGVKLAAADYTASNGSDVVLASGAATGDILEVVAFTTFNSASSSIDDNGDATAITIDSNENVMVGKTTSDSGATAGFEVNTSGRINATRDGSISGVFNRLTSDGEVVQFRKDGTILGSIGVESNTHLVISTPSNGGSLIFEGNDTGGSDTRLAMENNTGGEAFRPYNSYSDNKYNLGSGSRRFKDLYLSSGIYLGGAGSANHLDDYEEGTWTPSLVGYSGTPAFQDSYYTKIGRFVFATCRVSLDGTSDGSNFIISNLPFTSLGSTSSIFGSNIVYSNSGTAPTYSLVSVGTTQINFYDASGTNISYTSAGVNKNYRISITYFTT